MLAPPEGTGSFASSKFSPDDLECESFDRVVYGGCDVASLPSFSDGVLKKMSMLASNNGEGRGRVEGLKFQIAMMMGSKLTTHDGEISSYATE